MRTIFLLELERGKYFLYSSMNPNSPIELFLEAYFQNEYLKIYKPMNILDTWPETHVLDLDIQVKKQMLERGLDNVRGGSYSSTSLTPSQVACLTMELQGPTHECHKDVIKDILNTYVAKKWTNSDLKKERDRLYSNYSSYKREKEAHDKLCEINIVEARADIDWLENISIIQYDNFISGYMSNHLFSSEVVAKYRRILGNLRKIYKTFITVSNNLPIKNDDLPIKYPEFIFDDFIFNGHRILLEKDNVPRLCDQYRFFLLYLENRIEESAFDVASWRTDTYFTYVLSFLDLTIV